jgi:hypothetical protein
MKRLLVLGGFFLFISSCFPKKSDNQASRRGGSENTGMSITSPTSPIGGPFQLMPCDQDDDVHCYADRCAWQLAEQNRDDDWTINYMPEVAVDDATTVQITWNQKKITYAKAPLVIDNVADPKRIVYQYLFDGQPGRKDYPEKGANGSFVDTRDPTLAVQLPYLKTKPGKWQDWDKVRCEYLNGIAVERHSCMPDQRRHKVKKGKAKWNFIFRRFAPINPDVADVNSPFHKYYYPIVDALAWAKTSTIDHYGEENEWATCWFDTLDKSNKSGRKAPNWQMKSGKAYLPIPGGRWGESSAEVAQKKAINDFWDLPQDVKNGGCDICHVSGPVNDSPWYWEHTKYSHEKEDDSKFKSYSVAELHSAKTYIKMPETNACSDCHDWWVAKDNLNSEVITKNITNYTNIQTHDRLSNFSKGLDPMTLDAAGAPPPEDKRNAAQTHMMPPNAEMTVAKWKDTYEDSAKKLVDCMNNQFFCTTLKTQKARTAWYYGEHEPPPADAYNQKIFAPKTIDFLDIKIVKKADGTEDCDLQGTCSYEAIWRDPDGNRYRPGRLYHIDYDYPPLFQTEPRSDDGVVSTQAYCPKGVYWNTTSSYLGEWRYEFKKDIGRVRCGKEIEVRVCGEFGDAIDYAGNPDKATDMQGFSIDPGMVKKIQTKACPPAGGGTSCTNPAPGTVCLP